jgi:hypothetical protein
MIIAVISYVDARQKMLEARVDDFLVKRYRSADVVWFLPDRFALLNQAPAEADDRIVIPVSVK